MMIDKHTEILFNEQVAENTFLMGLHAPEIVDKALPGQFVMLRVGPAIDPLLRRPFSICGTMQGEQLLILYKVVGSGTALMAEAKPGTSLSVLGPLGRGFSQPREDKKPILVAGGIGIAPLIFLAQKISQYHPVFLAGYRRAAEIVPLSKVGLAADNVICTTDDGSFGHHGFVTDLLETELNAEPQGAVSVYACGPAAMLKKVAALAMEKQAPCQMSLEANMACGLGACQGCAVKSSNQDKTTYYLVCKDGPIFPARTIDWETI